MSGLWGRRSCKGAQNAEETTGEHVTGWGQHGGGTVRQALVEMFQGNFRRQGRINLMKRERTFEVGKSISKDQNRDKKGTVHSGTASHPK